MAVRARLREPWKRYISADLHSTGLALTRDGRELHWPFLEQESVSAKVEASTPKVHLFLNFRRLAGPQLYPHARREKGRVGRSYRKMI